MVCFFLVIVIFCVILFCVQVIYVDSVCFFFQDFIYNFEVKVEEVVFVEEFVNYDYMRVQILDNGIFEDQIVFSDFFDVDSLVDFGILNQQGLSDDQVVFLEENLGFEFVFFFSVKEDNFYVYDVQKDFFFQSLLILVIFRVLVLIFRSLILVLMILVLMFGVLLMMVQFFLMKV